MESSTVLLITAVSLSVLVECMETLPELCAGNVNLMWYINLLAMQCFYCEFYCSIIGNEMFLSKIRLNITGSADNRWRFPIIHLAIEDNLLKNNSNVFRFYHRIIYTIYKHYIQQLQYFAVILPFEPRNSV